MSEPEWVTLEEVVALNAEIVKLSLEGHGIIHGEKLEAAVNRPKQHFYYGPPDTSDDLVLLGVKLCVGISESQGFEQGNKRTGFAAMEMFLNNNGYQISSGAHGSIATLILASAAADKTVRLGEDAFAEELDPFVVPAGVDMLVDGILSSAGIGTIDQVMRELAEKNAANGIDLNISGIHGDPFGKPPTLDE